MEQGSLFPDHSIFSDDDREVSLETLRAQGRNELADALETLGKKEITPYARVQIIDGLSRVAMGGSTPDAQRILDSYYQLFTFPDDEPHLTLQ
jgi:hypothetical protein